MEIKKSPKIPKIFSCVFCNYSSSNKKDFFKHTMTRKHQKYINGNKMEIKNPQKVPTVNCSNCDKTFITISGLWKHKQKCCDIQDTINSTTNCVMPNVQTLADMVLDVVKQNNNLTQQNNKLTNELFDIYKNNTTTYTNINSHNKTFNLNLFLNEQCKDAMNIMDFVDSLKI